METQPMAIAAPRKKRVFSLFQECADYNLGLWECPSFIFLLLGLLNISAMIGTYYIANRYTNQPEYVALIVIAVTLIIFIVSHSITQGFDKLAQANKMKTEFVSIASHQLRTPLSAMRWTLNLLTDEKMTINEQDKENFFSMLKESDERMIKLVNDLLDVSKIEMGKMSFSPRQTNLFVLTQKIINSYSQFAKAHNIDIKMDANETLPNVFADPEKISLVVQNLVDNAIKYIEGKGEIEVKFENNRQYVKMSIKDTGVGIPESQKKHIFQKFFRSDNVMKHQTIGTGLGLFIAKSIIDESEGKIWFESKEGKETTFFFTLPIYK